MLTGHAMNGLQVPLSLTTAPLAAGFPALNIFVNDDCSAEVGPVQGAAEALPPMCASWRQFWASFTVVTCRSLRSWPRMGLASSRSGQLMAPSQGPCKLQLSSCVTHLSKPALVPIAPECPFTQQAVQQATRHHSILSPSTKGAATAVAVFKAHDEAGPLAAAGSKCYPSALLQVCWL